MFLNVLHIKNKPWWKSLFFMGIFMCLHSAAFSTSFDIDLGFEKETVVKTDHPISTSLCGNVTVLTHHLVVGNSKYFSARPARRSVVSAYRIALLSHKPIYLNVPTLVQAVKKAPTSIQFHECAIKLNDCHRILHLFYLY